MLGPIRRRRAAASLFAPWAAVAVALAFAACGGGSGGGADEAFRVLEINVADNAVWRINRPIEVRFSHEVDFDTVSLASIQIREVGGAPTIGEFYHPTLPGGTLDRSTVLFQPRCPLKDDLSDAGLRPGGVRYALLLSADAAGASVRSLSGARLLRSESRTFTTASGTLGSELFFDPVVGPPRPRIRDAGETGTEFSHVQIGGDPSQRIYFERAPDGSVSLAGGARLPLALLSNRATAVTLEIVFDQPVLPFATNIDDRRLRWEYDDGAGTWRRMGTRVSLVRNCTGAGAVVRIEPAGVLPPDAALRAVVTTEFSDLVGETNAFTLDTFAPARSQPPPAVLADSVEEEFATSTQDESAGGGDPLALWGDGRVEAAFSFDGSGGLGGDFDWEVLPGENVILDTVFATITGGPGFVPTKQQVVFNGLVDVRNLRIGQGALVQVQGPNPLRIVASGTVEIYGRIEINGGDHFGITGVDLPGLPVAGAPGNSGGGRGGTSSPLTTASTPRGGRGFGAFGQTDAGGEGGEASWNDTNGIVDARRGNGGGGGVFGRNQPSANPATQGEWDQSVVGLDAEQGFPNLAQTTPLPKGAVTGVNPPTGGLPGPSPFVDEHQDNDYFGARYDAVTGRVVVGELKRLWAGPGGGAGGDASFTFGQPWPQVPFDPQGDEKGGPGGGGGGAIEVLALGDIIIGNGGLIRARGGRGGGGESTNAIDRAGGGGGGGAGGHIVLQTASRIDLSGAGNAIAVDATGGQGGCGRNSIGGAVSGVGTAGPSDACPPGYPTGSSTNACRGHVDGAGGDGGPGIVQFHTPNGLAGGDILLPPGVALREVSKPIPIYTTPTDRMIPTFGRTSSARSHWIALGLGGFDSSAPGAPFKPAAFDLGQVDPATGFVQTVGGQVALSAPILGPAPLVNPNLGLPHIAALEPRTLVMDATAILSGPNAIYGDNIGLLEHFVLRLSQIGMPSVGRRYDVVSAALDRNAVPPRLTLRVSNEGPPLTTFTPPGGPEAALIPSYFRVRTDGVLDELPDAATVRIRFQAAPADPASPTTPDLTRVVPGPGPEDFTSDPAVLNASPFNRDLRFLRFDVRFDIDALGGGLTPESPIPSLEFLRFPFRF